VAAELEPRFARVQRSELLALGLERIVADLAAAEFTPPHGLTKDPLFEGAELPSRSYDRRSARTRRAVLRSCGSRKSTTGVVWRWSVARPGRAAAPQGTQQPSRLGDPVVLVRALPDIVRYVGTDRCGGALARRDPLPRACASRCAMS
jgi:general secretion pathway protein J